MKISPNEVRSKFQFSETTLSYIKDGAKNYERFAKSISQVRSDAFIYGYKGGTADKPFTQDERKDANYLLNKMAKALEDCKHWNRTKTWSLYNLVSGMNDRIVPGKRFSDCDLLDELVKITYFWAFEVNKEMPNIYIVKDVMDLWEWYVCLYNQAELDLEEHKEIGN